MKNRGFTLIELMITVAVIAILAAIAYPSYEAYVLRTYRTAARSCLIELAQWMERHYSSHMSYVSAVLPSTACRSDLATRYTFSLDGAPTSTTFRLKAVPVGTQARDSCGELTIDQRDQRTPTSAGCWN
ncbi:MAG: type IV pilin protein [Tepidimonas sp.]|uniref:type IV pilin protein n=1 Tax=Tepidimonas sp. TaxID=2002775 RepID=UPI00259F017F|nr:type IV pilin protein [Tepidimonas sp.]MDM7457027.1 type IV pilin protein [Tepidimonas sp.]